MYIPSREDSISLIERFNSLSGNINLEQKQYELEDLKTRQQDPLFWEDPDNAVSVSRKITELEEFIKDFNELHDCVDICEMFFDDEPMELSDDEISSVYEKAVGLLEKFEMFNVFSEEGDSMSCALKITAGAGGTEAQNWAWMLMRMYIQWCELHGFSKTVTDVSFADGEKLLKSVTILVEGENAYGLLKCETGIHRLVRVSPYNAQGKRQTSFASVFVTPVVDDSINIELDKSKMSVEFFRSSGAGGQNVNKVETGCRVRYQYTDPDTGETEEIRVENTETRKQHDNRDRAEMLLKSILYKKELDRKNKKKQELEDSKPEIGWGAQIRSYVFDDSRVKDHRTGYQESDVAGVMNGHIDGFIKAYLLGKF